jgi:hypothetical protein
MQCEFGQGFLFSPPLPAEDLLRMLRERGLTMPVPQPGPTQRIAQVDLTSAQ